VRQRRLLQLPPRRRSFEVVDEEERELPDVLLHRAAEAREGAMSARCAWCGRYRAGGRWFRLEHASSVIDEERLSHGICPACSAELRRQGMSI